MSHMVERMAFTGRTPWHTLGATMADPTSVDRCFADAGLDYDALVGPCYDQDHNEVAFQRSIVRSTDRKCVGIVGSSFMPLQPSAMADFVRPWVEGGHATIETAGILQEGRRVWALAKLGGRADVGDGDGVERYLLIAHAYDGSLAITAGLTPIRVVCANTLGAALGGGRGALIKIRHTKNSTKTLEAVKKAMQAADLQWNVMVEAFRKMTQVQVRSEAAARAFIRAVFGDTMEEKKRKRRPREDKIIELFENGKGQDLSSAKNTLWGLYNGVTEYLSHARGNNDESRASSLAFGSSAELLLRADSMVSAILDNGEIGTRGIEIGDVFGVDSEVDRAAARAVAGAN